MNSVPAVTNNSTVAPTAPGAPTGLTATASGTTQIDLSWTAPADNGGRVITGYKIEISPNGTDTWTDPQPPTPPTPPPTRTPAWPPAPPATTASPPSTPSAPAPPPTSTTPPRAPQTPAPTASNGEVTATEDTDYPFTAANFNFSDTDAGAALSSVKVTSLPASGNGTLKVDGTVIASGDLPKAVTKVDIDASKLTYSPPANANGDDYATFQFKVNDGTDDSAIASTMTIDVTAVNDAATGELAIMGQPVFGATLTLDYSAIMDVDGLPDLSQSQIFWYHTDSGNPEASQTTTYTLSRKDVGKAIRSGHGVRGQRRWKGGFGAVALAGHRHHYRHRPQRPDRAHGHGQRDHPDRPLLDRPRQPRRHRHHRLQDRDLLRRRQCLGRPTSPTPPTPTPPTRTPAWPPAPPATTASRPSTPSAPAPPPTSTTPPRAPVQTPRPRPRTAR